ncbi:MAG: hypothetical protein IRY96_01310 [Burkholderiales bacterium]|nr:hypothetical protein [Burkholderiales bacterium]PZM98785.1 MAG: hypothetical protein DIU74_13225 [Pseudomonadota bacterium]
MAERRKLSDVHATTMPGGRDAGTTEEGQQTQDGETLQQQQGGGFSMQYGAGKSRFRLVDLPPEDLD